MQSDPRLQEPLRLILRDDFPELIYALLRLGYEVIGPTIRDQAIIYDRIQRVEDLPIGWTDEQEAGHYRLKRRNDSALFGYNVGPHAWKKFLHVPRLTLWKASATESGFDIRSKDDQVPQQAFLGVRACELQAIKIQDQVLCRGGFTDSHYQSRREQSLIIAVQCTQAGATCFCESMDAGPRADSGFDLAITELVDAERHVFVVETGSRPGREIIDQIPHQTAKSGDMEQALTVSEQVRAQMGREIQTDDIRDLLYRNLEHERWEELGERCLACTNCTMVCPTCFCTSVEDVTDLAGNTAERNRQWDSCFNSDFSYIHGGNVRQSIASRYRQWMTHKLASWQDQFGSSGCVGCGRCITWCPVGIDLTREAAAIRASDCGNPTGEGEH